MSIEPRLRTAVLSVYEASAANVLEVLQVGPPGGSGVLFLDLDPAAAAATRTILNAWKPRLAIVTLEEAEARLTVDLVADSWLRVVYVDPDGDDDTDGEAAEESRNVLRILLRATVQEMLSEDQPKDHHGIEAVYEALKAQLAVKDPERAAEMRSLLGREVIDAAEGLQRDLRALHTAWFRTQAPELAAEIQASAALTAGASKAALRAAVTTHMKVKDPRCATRESTDPIVLALDVLLRNT